MHSAGHDVEKKSNSGGEAHPAGHSLRCLKYKNIRAIDIFVTGNCVRTYFYFTRFITGLQYKGASTGKINANS